MNKIQKEALEQYPFNWHGGVDENSSGRLAFEIGAEWTVENFQIERMACFIKNRMGFLEGDQRKDADEFVDNYFDKNGGKE